MADNQSAAGTGVQAGTAPTSSSKVLYFDGTNNYIELPPIDFDFSKGLTIEAWARYAKLNHFSRIIDFGNGPGVDNIILTNEATSATLGLYLFVGGVRPYLTAASMLEIDKWMHLAATIDAAGKATLYKDGKPLNTGPVSLPAKLLRKNSYIGRSNWSNDGFFAGRMSELRLWNRARSVEEIQANQHRRLAGNEPGLVGYWPLNDGQGTVAQDKTTQGNHGKLQNCTWEQAEIPLATEDRPKPGVSPSVPGPAHWYRGENNANDSAGTANGMIVGTVGYAPGVGQSFSFSGNGQVKVPNDSTFQPAQLTLDAFVKPSTSGVLAGIVSTEDAGKGTAGFGFRQRPNDTFWFVIGGEGYGIYVESTTKLVAGNWYHLTGTYDGTTAKLYVNGALEGSRAQGSPTPLTSTVGLSIGALPSGGEPFKGQIDEVQVYDRVVLPPVPQPGVPTVVTPPPPVVSPPGGAGTPSVLVNNATGTQAGPAPTSGSKVLYFDGTNNYVEFPPLDFDFSKGFTIEAWARYAKFNHFSRIIDFGNGPGVDNIILTNEATSATLGLYLFVGGVRPYLTAASMLEIDKWMHLAATIDAAGKATLYKDGKPLNTGPVTLPAKLLRKNSYIGRSNWPNDGYFAGRMSELRLWNLARSAEEIQANQHRRLTGNEPGLVGYWPLNDGQGTVAQDKTTQGNHGKLQNCTWEQAEIPLATEDRTKPGVSPSVPGLAHWYRGENNANDSAGTANGMIVGTVGYAPGVGQSFSFSGNGQVKVPNDSTFQPAQLTLDAFVKPSTSGVLAGIISTEDAGRGTAGFGFRQRPDDTFWFVVGGEGYGIAAESTTKLVAGNWYRLTGTYDGTTAKLYVNGALEGSRVQGSPTPLSSTAGLSIGALPSGGEPFKGQIDEVQVYNRVVLPPVPQPGAATVVTSPPPVVSPPGAAIVVTPPPPVVSPPAGAGTPSVPVNNATGPGTTTGQAPKVAPQPPEQPQTAVPANPPVSGPESEKEKYLCTGLEDYGVWLKWRETEPKKPLPPGETFRRGRIWS